MNIPGARTNFNENPDGRGDTPSPGVIASVSRVNAALVFTMPLTLSGERSQTMNPLRSSLPLILIAFISVLAGCSGHQPATLDEALTLFRGNKLNEALPLLEQLAARDSSSSSEHTWLAETYRRLGQKEKALASARRALELNPRNSFAHMVIAETSNPVVGNWAQANSDTTWYHIMKAVECDSTDGNPWLLVWGEAIHRGEPAMMHKSLRKLVETGFLTETALAYGRWMLRGLPPNAILLTNGDMDTYPPCAVQEVEGFRRDVAIVNCGTLNESWYARFVRDDEHVPLPFDDEQLDHLTASNKDGNVVLPSDKIFAGWIAQKSAGSLDRPLTVAVTVEETYYANARGNMRFAGAFLEWTDAVSAQIPDTEAVRAGLLETDPDAFTGPWVSEQDRSPIRRVFTKNIVRNVTHAALVYAEALMKEDRDAEADRWVRWADRVDKESELGPVFTEQVSHLKEEIAKTKRR